MGTVIQDKPQSNPERQPRWDRFERANRFEHYLELQAQGVSQRQAAQELQQGHSVFGRSLQIKPKTS